MVSPSQISRCRRALWLGAVWCVAAFGVWGISSARAQQQESGLLDRIDHPDRTMKNSMADKSFSTSSSVSGKQAAVHPFIFGHASTFNAGDGAFNTRAFHGKDGYHTESYGTRVAATGKEGFAQTNKSFGTKTADVHEDRAANKAAPVQAYVPGDKSIVIRGKRQDDLDDLYHQKNLDIAQVRELLNKPGNSTDAPVQRTVEAPVFRAQAVPAPAAR